MDRLSGFTNFMKRLRGWWLRNIKKKKVKQGDIQKQSDIELEEGKESSEPPAGTYVQKLTVSWLTQALQDKMDYEIFVWRSVSVRFLRSVIYPDWGGKFWLKVLFFIEELFPRLLGRIGQYPLVVVKKPLDEKSES
jgi:hypothetical protein